MNLRAHRMQEPVLVPQCTSEEIGAKWLPDSMQLLLLSNLILCLHQYLAGEQAFNERSLL